MRKKKDEISKVIVFGPGMVNTLGMIRSLGEKGLCVHVIMSTVDRKKNYVGYCKYINKAYYIKDNNEIIRILHDEYWNEPKRIAILCGGDAEISLLDQYYEELKQRFLVFNCGEEGKLNSFLNKINQFPIAEAAGLTLIKTWVINTIENVPNDIKFPCLTKGSNSTESTKSDMHICHSYGELKAHLKKGTKYLVQEFIKKEYELNFVCFAYNNGNNVFVPCVIHKIRDDIGRQSAYFRTDAISNYPDFDKQVLYRIASQLHYEGIFSVEVIYSQGHYYFLEINLRNDGCGYLYTKAGCNYPFLWAKYASKELSSQETDSINVKIPCSMMSEQDLKNLFQNRVCFLIWIKQFLFADTFYILSLRDPLPFIFSTLSHIKQAFKNITRYESQSH